MPASDLTASPDHSVPSAGGLRTAFELFDLGVAMHRQTLHRRYPGESPAAIDARVQVWLRERPGAEHGDGVGRPIPVLPRPARVEP